MVGSDAFKSVRELANENGLAADGHQVVTKDGYILSVWRIPGALGEEPSDVAKPPVLLVHSLECDMMQWVFHKPDVAHAFVLAR